MKPEDTKKIIQIIPANGFSAVYADEENGEWKPLLLPLACWALVEDGDGERTVEGMDGSDYVEFCEDNANFLGYAGVGEDVKTWDAEARKYGERQAKKLNASNRAS